MILHIDTKSSTTILHLLASKGETIDKLIKETSFSQSEKLIGLIDHLLEKNGSSKKDLSMIGVDPGPGSYTGIRVGVTTANFIAFGLDIKIIADSLTDFLEKIRKNNIDSKFDSFALPFYGKEAFITKEKPRL